jgi:hypothetical protein
MYTIYKYQLEVRREIHVQMPVWARPLSVQIQNGKLTLWAVVDPNSTLADHVFYLIGTGQEMTGRERTFISTVQAGEFVWHIFDSEEEWDYRREE